MFRKFFFSGYPRAAEIVNVRYCSTESVNNGVGSGKGKTMQRSPITRIPLNEKVPGLPIPIYAAPCSTSKETKITTLENGLRIASEDKIGSFCTVGVLLDSGSRYECAYPSGMSHFLQKLAYGNTLYKSGSEINETLEKLGSIRDCQASRDTLIYAVSVNTTGLEKTIEILGDVVLRPEIADDELKDAQMHISYELESLHLRPEKDLLLLEMAHAAAYKDNSVGLPYICPPENIAVINRNTLFTYMKQHHTPERMVIAGVGVNHDELVEYAQKYFVDTKPIWETETSLANLKPSLAVDKSFAQYTGGIVQQEADLSDVSLGPNPLPELAHVVLSVESVGHLHEDYVTCAVLNMLMGGGGSFSSGGPGKGMYTRLYTNVLNRYHWMHNAVAQNHAYIDTGLFCILVSCHPSYLGDMTRIISQEMVGMAGHIEEEEFNRAKVLLQSLFLMNLELRPVLFEDIGRQVLATGIRHQPEYFMEKIKNVTREDIVRVSSEMLSSKPSVAAMGSLRKLPPLSDIGALLAHGGGRISSKSRFKLFR